MKLSKIVEKWRKRKKGHFAVYTEDGKRFVLSLYYLDHPIFRVLLEMTEEEFGTMVNGPLQVPCKEELMDYILSLPRKNSSENIEKALVSLSATCKGVSGSTFFPRFHAQSQDVRQNVLSL